MATIEARFVQGDTGPDITAQIHDFDDPTLATNLTNCTVRFQMRKSDDTRYQVDEPATITNASQGLVAYQWGVKDLNVPGDYDVQWEVTFPDSKIQTTVLPNKITVRRQ